MKVYTKDVAGFVVVVYSYAASGALTITYRLDDVAAKFRPKAKLKAEALAQDRRSRIEFNTPIPKYPNNADVLVRA